MFALFTFIVCQESSNPISHAEMLTEQKF